MGVLERNMVREFTLDQSGNCSSARDTMTEEINENTAYLMALRNSTGAASAPALAHDDAPSTATTPANDPPFQGAEKRRSRRFKCVGSAEMREEGSDVHTWAAFTDISLHGCYVEAQATYPAGTSLYLKLEANGIRVETKAVVRVNYPYLGMGIALVDISEENRARLKELLNSVSRSFVSMGPGLASPIEHSGTNAMPLISDPPAAVQALMTFFEGHLVLTREEFMNTLRRSQLSPKPR